MTGSCDALAGVSVLGRLLKVVKFADAPSGFPIKFGDPDWATIAIVEFAILVFFATLYFKILTDGQTSHHVTLEETISHVREGCVPEEHVDAQCSSNTPVTVDDVADTTPVSAPTNGPFEVLTIKEEKGWLEVSMTEEKEKEAERGDPKEVEGVAQVKEEAPLRRTRTRSKQSQAENIDSALSSPLSRRRSSRLVKAPATSFV